MYIYINIYTNQKKQKQYLPLGPLKQEALVKLLLSFFLQASTHASKVQRSATTPFAWHSTIFGAKIKNPNAIAIINTANPHLLVVSIVGNLFFLFDIKMYEFE